MSQTIQPLVYAGFWSRIGASLIDTVAQLLLLWPIMFLVKSMGHSPTNLQELFINVLVPMGITIWMWGRFGATPGKMAIGAKVLDASTGKPPSARQSVIRYLSYFVSAIPLGLGFLAIVWSPKKQGWHDKIANTVVMRPGEWQLSENGTLIAGE